MSIVIPKHSVLCTGTGVMKRFALSVMHNESSAEF